MSKNSIYKVLGAMVVCMSCFINNSRAQSLSDVKDLTYNHDSNLREKLFMHINKSLYLTGEILWFKIYCTEGSTNKMLNLSKVAYVELLDSNHTAVMQTKIALSVGTGNGSLYIPFSLSSGNFQVRAYTNWMKNFDADYFFESQITIINPLKKPVAEVKKATSAYDVQFFPEGGDLVNGLTSKVAFKITGVDGKGLPGTGAIINARNDTVAHFKTLKFGIGSFTVKPVANEIYKAVVRVNNVVTVNKLPEINLSGYVMNATDSGIKWDIYINNSDTASSLTMYAIIHNNRAVNLAEGLQLIKGKTHFSIDKSKLEDGVNFITVFDDRKKPVCERLIFKRPAKKLMIDARANEPIYHTREKVNLIIASQDQNRRSIPANLSVSVFRADTLQNENVSHIAGYLWVRADLKGYVESPDYYIEDTTSNANAALDNLMLSQGWSQFDAAKRAKNGNARLKFLPEYTGPIINGYIINSKSNAPARNVKAYLTIHGKPDQLYIAKSDSAGKLLFNTQKFSGLREIVVQTNSQIDSTYIIAVLNPFDERHAGAKVPVFTLSRDMRQALADNSLNMQVVNIFSTDKLKEFYSPHDNSTSFYGKPDKTYMLDDYTRFTTIEEVLREYVRSIAVMKRQGKFDLKIFNVDKLLGQPLILLDGVPIFDEDEIFKIDPLKIRKLEMVTKNYLYGPDFFNGIMSFFTYKGNGVNIAINPNIVVLDYEGLQQERKFYSPVYGSDAQINTPIPDFRTALYWNPKADTGTNGTTELTFYTGDKPGVYVGIIEGIANGGETGSQHFNFEVKK